jgi:hypothetical protein
MTPLAVTETSEDIGRRYGGDVSCEGRRSMKMVNVKSKA